MQEITREHRGAPSDAGAPVKEEGEYLPTRISPKKITTLHPLHDKTVNFNLCSHDSTLLLDIKPHTPIFFLTRDMLCCDDMYDACTDDTYDVCTASIDDSPISKSDRYSSRHMLLDTGARQSVFKDKTVHKMDCDIIAK